MKKIVLAVAIVAVLAMAFTSVGYAYTASTENSGNSVTSQYVTLTQQNYTFAGGSVSFNVIETEAGIKYQLVGTTYELTDIEGQGYIGTKIGSDKLSATMTGGSGGVLDVAVSSPQLNGSWFTDYSGDLYGWRYVLKAYVDCDATESVANINALGAPAVGTCYKLSDAGTLTRGNLAVAIGDVVGYDGSAWVLVPDQYAYYSGSSNGMWIIKGQPIASQYRVAAVDADAGGYIKLYSTDTIKDITVVVVQGNVIREVYVNKGVTEPIDLTKLGAGPWYVDGRLIENGKYTVEEADTDAGCNVVISDRKTGSGSTFDVVKIDNGTATLETGKTAGQAVDGVDGWHVGGGIKLRILTGVTYETELYFAGAGGNVNSSLRSPGTTIKAPSQITIIPEWIPAGAADTLSYTLKASDSPGAETRTVFVDLGSDVLLPDNCFTAPVGKVFVGWKADNSQKVFTSAHLYKGFNESRTFTAQWAAVGSCLTMKFEAGTGGEGEMIDRYVLRNDDTGNTYSLPPCGFTNPGHRFIGWQVIGDSGRSYSDYTSQFTDIPGVKENLTITAMWEEAPVGGEDVSISFDANTVILIPSEGSASVISGKHIGDTIDLDGDWFVKGKPFTGDYTLRDSDVLHGGYIVLYQDQNDEDEYRVIKVEGDWVEVSGTLTENALIDEVGGWRINGASVYGGMYIVREADEDDSDSRIIVLYEFTNPKDEYTVIMVPSSGNPTMTRGLHADDTVPYTGTWYVKGDEVTTSEYIVDPGDAVNGFIVLYQTANELGKYTVVKAGVNGATAIRNLRADSIEDAVTGVKGWKVKGEEIGIYKVRAEDAENGFILIYDNAAATYLYHTGVNGSYTLPYCYEAPPKDPAIMNFKGWKLMGWEVVSTPGRNAAQSYTMPTGTDGYIVKNGTIKFTYSNDLHNGEAA
ncbi:MAG: hypothetical protein E7Z69_00800 [Thermoplasmata archaeon]|nr:hypothetical protein [Thermoplasmata archaeon]